MKILWLKNELLHPVDRGGRIRTYQMLRALSREHQVTYLTLSDGAAAPDALQRAAEYAAEVVEVPFQPAARHSPRFFVELALTLGSRLPYALWKYRSPTFERALERLVGERRFDVVVCDFLFPAVNVRRPLPIPTVLFQHNVEAEIWRRHAEVAARPWSRAYFRLQWRRMERFERAACRRFDLVVAVSASDEALMRTLYAAPRVVTVPTGVDTEYFRPSGTVARDPQNVIFVGAMDWMPNEDGVHFFAREVWPSLSRQFPGASFTIVGRNPPPEVRALAASLPRVEVTGSVPDVRPYLERAGLVVVPLRVGGGTRLKIYEALAMERPLVSTRIGAEGLPLADGEHIALADTGPELVERCASLLSDGARAEKLGQGGAAFVRARFSWDGVTRKFAELCATAVSRRSEALAATPAAAPLGESAGER